MPVNVELRTRLTPTVRHEFGHWVVARHLGFRTGLVYVEQQQLNLLETLLVNPRMPANNPAPAANHRIAIAA